MRHFFIPLVLFTAHILSAAPVVQPHIEVDLVSEVKSVRAGEPFTVAVKLKMEDHWHTYWLNPGDSGLPTEVKWTLPEGFVAGEIQWPIPSRIDQPPLTSYGYEHEIWLLAKITPPKELKKGSNISLHASVSWLVCKESCIPGNADLKLALPAGEGGDNIDPTVRNAFERARNHLLKGKLPGQASAELDGKNIILTFDSVEKKNSFQFFPYEAGVFNSAAVQNLKISGSLSKLTIPLSEDVKTVSNVKGVVIFSDGVERLGYEIDLPVRQSPSTGSSGGLPFYLLAAFIGGLILNLMPCVFPVLSIKIMGIMRQAGEDRGKIRMHGIWFAAGVLLSFWILAAALLVLRNFGNEIGWGFQLQSPWFVLLLALILFALGLSMVGVFEIGTSFVGIGAKVGGGHTVVGSLSSGVLATVVATPCTAPFMGASVAFALSQPFVVSMGVFTALAMGLAAPYVALTWSPALIARLPRPGAWMESLKQAMSFPLFGAAIWLLWVLGQQAGNNALFAGMLSVLSLAVAAWIYGRWGSVSRSSASRAVACISAGVFLLLSLLIVYGVDRFTMAPAAHQTSGRGNWQAYSPELLEKLRAEGKPVFVDFTAAWCLTCQVNKVVLRSGDISKKFHELGVVTLEGDWTRRDPVISKALEQLGRQGVPVYVFYAPGAKDGDLLPEILTKKIVLDALDKSSGTRKLSDP